MFALVFSLHFDCEEVPGVEGQEVTVTPGMFLAPLLLGGFLNGLLAVYNFEVILLYHIDGLAVDYELSSSLRFTVMTVQQTVCSCQVHILTGLQGGVQEDQLGALHCGLLGYLPLVPCLVREIVGQDQGHWARDWHRACRPEAGDSLQMDQVSQWGREDWRNTIIPTSTIGNLV